jgi:MFS transporter, PPP family, 3-phenylpropionic acid transporter
MVLAFVSQIRVHGSRFGRAVKRVSAGRGLPSKPLTDHWFVSSYFFFFFLAQGATSPFLAPYYKESLGFSDRSLGLLIFSRSIVSLIAVPFWSFIADRFAFRSRLAAMLAMASAIALSGVSCTRGSVASFAAIVLFYCLYNSQGSLGNAVAMGTLGEKDRSRFANLRIWGTAGFIVAVLSSGALMDRFGWSAMFAVFAAAMVVAGICIGRIPEHSPVKRARIADVISLVYANAACVRFFAIILLVAMAQGATLEFQSVYLRKLGSTKAQIGLLWTVATFAELAFMPFIPGIIRRLGVKKTVGLGILATGLRSVPAAFLGSWWQFMPFQLLHPFTWGFMTIGSLTFVDILFPSHLRASGQAFYSMVTTLGSLAAGLLAGEIAHRFGYPAIFLIMGATALALTPVFFAAVSEPKSIAPPIPHS